MALMSVRQICLLLNHLLPLDILALLSMSPPKYTIVLSLASFNVGSLFAQPDGLSYLRHQMHGHSLNVVGIQESRSSQGFSMAEGILRIAGGADKGHHGVELWISTKQPFAYVKGRPQYIQRSHVQLLHHDPRRLVVRIASHHLNCFIAVLHAPQTGQPLPVREEWWLDTTQLVSEICREHPLFVLADANAKTGPSQPHIVFEHDDSASSSTPCFLACLRDLGLCLPCTSACHIGRQGTWTNIGRLDQHRIDYVCIPQDFLFCEHSQVVDSFDAGNAHEDDTAIQLVWHGECNRAPRQQRVARHDRARMSTDIETQVTHLNTNRSLP